MNISLIIPVFNEEFNLNIFFDEILTSGVYENVKEIIFVDDCSIDGSVTIIKKLTNKYNKVVVKINDINRGQSYSIYNGILISNYDIIATIDSDGQNIPEDLFKLIKLFKSHKYDLVSGIRKIRNDSLIKRISSKIANRYRMFILKDSCKDTGCSLKIFKKSIFLKFKYFNGIHRFIPSLFECNGFKVNYTKVGHRARMYGFSNYGTYKRMINGIIDTYKVKKIISNFNKND
tara:strand:- start:1579 stop:2274 length:696 start_codon:yes stop_codon:yes gene_type:complete